MTGVELIAAERQRQVEVEGWSPAHDQLHEKGELAQAAACYAWVPPRPIEVKTAWPFHFRWWKPNAVLADKKGRIRDLAKAGALIAAEIDRLQASQK